MSSFLTVDRFIQLLNSADHDYFYTNAQVHQGNLSPVSLQLISSHQVVAAWKTYIQAWVSRYQNEPTILGWWVAAGLVDV